MARSGSSTIVLKRFSGQYDRTELNTEKAFGDRAEALKGLEDVICKPPRKALVKSRKYFSNIKYLPDLLGDSLEGYKKKVFIGVGLPEEEKGPPTPSIPSGSLLRKSVSLIEDTSKTSTLESSFDHFQQKLAYSEENS
ncbi:hypothetical protein Fmac_032507 [Flemingia macrophylla]|uniref:DUF7870 domain-containing protein n=1 Tax=Flemingia macrophylla TaxID=520843 RepID=A0ABD1L572_9FABA